jgi:hypothetical protein
MKKILITFSLMLFWFYSFSQTQKKDSSSLIDYIEKVTKKHVIYVVTDLRRDSIKIQKLIVTSFDDQKKEWVTDTLRTPTEIKRRFPNLELIMKTPSDMLMRIDRIKD